MNKKNYLRPNLEVVEVSSQLMQSGSPTTGGGESAPRSSRSLNSFEDDD